MMLHTRLGAQVVFDLDGKRHTMQLVHKLDPLRLDQMTADSPVGQVLATAAQDVPTAAETPGGPVQVTVLEIHG